MKAFSDSEFVNINFYINKGMHFLFIQTNTFQGVIITDTVRTYYAFTYVCGAMEWSGQATETATVGFNSNGNYFYNHPANGLADVNEIIACSIDTEGRRNKRETDQLDQGNGGQTDQLPSDSELMMSKQLCMALADADDSIFMDITEFPSLDDLPKCDRTRTQLVEVGVSFQQFDYQVGDCYRSNMVVTVINDLTGGSLDLVNVCCYDTNG